jgi:hypothetical protein
MTFIGNIFTQLMRAREFLFRKKTYIEFHENLTHDLASAMMSHTERHVILT